MLSLLLALASTNAVTASELKKEISLGLQVSASLTELTNRHHQLRLPLSFATLKLLASTRTHSGQEIKIFRISVKYSECVDGRPGLQAKTCPRGSILISTVYDLEGGSQFRLYKTSARLNWVMPDTKLPNEIVDRPYIGILLACEASAAVDAGKVNPSNNDQWHFVEYQLQISNFDKVSLVRLPDQKKYSHC